MKGLFLLLGVLAIVSANIVADAGEQVSSVKAPEAVSAPQLFKRSRSRTVVVESSAPEVSSPLVRGRLFQRLFSSNVEVKREVRSRGRLFSRSVSRGVCANGSCD